MRYFFRKKNKKNFIYESPPSRSAASCSATINGRMMIFGGDLDTPYEKQISVVEHCGLTRVGDLPVRFYAGGCNTFTTSLGDEETLLCSVPVHNGKTTCHT